MIQLQKEDPVSLLSFNDKLALFPVLILSGSRWKITWSLSWSMEEWATI